MQNSPISEIRELAPASGPRSSRRAWIAVAVVAVAALSLWVLGSILDVVLIVFAGLLWAIFLRSVADWASRRTHVPAGWCLATLLGSIVAALGLGVWLLAPSVAAQVDELSGTVASTAGQLAAQLEHYGWGRKLVSSLADYQDRLRFDETIHTAKTLLSSTIGGLTGAIVVLAVGVFVAASPSLYRRGLLYLVPIRRRARADMILDEVGDVLCGWLLGKTVSMAAVGVATWVGLSLLGVPLALTLALLAAALTFIPNLGPLLALTPAVLLGLTQGLGKAAAVFALYMGIQLVESYLLTPLVQRKVIAMPPALILVAQLLLGVLGGTLGLLVATPLCAAAIVLVRRVYVEGVLGDRRAATADEHDPLTGLEHRA